MKKFCEYLRESTMKIINFKKKIMKLKNSRNHVCPEKSGKKKHLKDEKYCNVRDHCHNTGEYRGAANSIYNLK